MHTFVLVMFIMQAIASVCGMATLSKSNNKTTDMISITINVMVMLWAAMLLWG